MPVSIRVGWYMNKVDQWVRQSAPDIAQFVADVLAPDREDERREKAARARAWALSRSEHVHNQQWKHIFTGSPVERPVSIGFVTARCVKACCALLLFENHSLPSHLATRAACVEDPALCEEHTSPQVGKFKSGLPPVMSVRRFSCL